MKIIPKLQRGRYIPEKWGAGINGYQTEQSDAISSNPSVQLTRTRLTKLRADATVKREQGKSQRGKKLRTPTRDFSPKGTVVVSTTNPDEGQIVGDELTPINVPQLTIPTTGTPEESEFLRWKWNKDVVQPQKQEQAMRNIGAFLNPLLPSLWVGAFAGKEPFLTSLVEGNKGLGEIVEGGEVANLPFDIVAPWAASKGVSAVSRAMASPEWKYMTTFKRPQYRGGWGRFGPIEYRYDPNIAYGGIPAPSDIRLISNTATKKPYIVPNTSISTLEERIAAITPEQLANREYFPVEIYGKDPIYTRETFPKIVVREAEDIENPTIMDDITYMNENFDKHTMDTRLVAANRLKLWKESPHGRAINFGSDLDLSSDSWWDTFRFNMNRHLDGTGTAYIPDNFGLAEMFLNDAGHRPISQETVDFFNAGIDKYNARTGLNIPHTRFVPESIKKLPAGRELKIPARIYAPNLGLMKHKFGGKI